MLVLVEDTALSDGDIDMVAKHVDLDDDGLISWREFLKAFGTVKGLPSDPRCLAGLPVPSLCHLWTVPNPLLPCHFCTRICTDTHVDTCTCTRVYATCTRRIRVLQTPCLNKKLGYTRIHCVY